MTKTVMLKMHLYRNENLYLGMILVILSRLMMMSAIIKRVGLMRFLKERMLMALKVKMMILQKIQTVVMMWVGILMMNPRKMITLVEGSIL